MAISLFVGVLLASVIAWCAAAYHGAIFTFGAWANKAHDRYVPQWFGNDFSPTLLGHRRKAARAAVAFFATLCLAMVIGLFGLQK